MTSHAAGRSIVCFSHLDWDSQQAQPTRELLLQMASTGHSIYYIACTGSKAGISKKASLAGNDAANVNLFALNYAPGESHLKSFRRWLGGIRTATILVKERVQQPVLWFCHPHLFSLGYSHPDAAIVYDVTEQFSWPQETRDDYYFDELTLLAETDLVLAHGTHIARHVQRLMNDLGRHPSWESSLNGDTVQSSSLENVLYTIPADQQWKPVAANIENLLHKTINQHRQLAR